MTIRKMAAVVAGTAAMALVLTSCAESDRDDGDNGGDNAAGDNADGTDSTAGGDDGDAAASDATFIFGAAGAPATFDPFYASDGETFRISRQIYQNLIGIEPGGTNGVPELATDWSSDDGLTWTFTLQEGVTFHDGTDFNAEAVCYNMDRWQDQNEVGQSPAMAYYYGNDFGFGDGSLYESCTAVDETTAEVVVSRVTGKFPMVLSQSSYAMQSPTALEEFNANDVQAQGDAFVFPEYDKNPTGTGPFMFEAYDNAGGTVTLVRNDDYWGEEKAGVANLVFKIVPDENARRQELEAGTIHGYDLPNPVDWQALEDSGNQVEIRDPFNILYVGLNPIADPQLADPLVRQALYHALNRDQFVATQLPEGASVATQFMPNTVSGYDDTIEAYEYDVEKAKDLLEQAGKSDLTIELWYPSEVTRPYMPDPQRVYDAVKTDWEAAGITVETVTKPWAGGYIDGAQTNQAPAYFLGWTGDLNSADNFLCAFFCGDENAFGTSEYDWQGELQESLTAADGEPDEAAREQLYKDLNTKIMSPEWLPGLPLSHSPPAIVVGPNVQGLVASPLTAEDFSTVTISE
ncbi:ABC transporter substrate-binding protein [Ornithinimicrobium cryptoxanthini]|uniref:ABC transporter substrate-binding protein n=1 Tax=Ornithinimicrobium cryptoxanthini TaxID=2934161 RepID=A0ABY4YJW8_9MICO|nr:ABC transporter substrate-binding protein [Ornithinimicrobium cryptoxanthini]USQ77095.1 ABC transporter substrate-binding protein [Ornithinimicrobium cryptoxanthini]